MNPSAQSHCKWKVHEIKAHLDEENNRGHYIPFIAITETWLEPHIQDAQINIPDYILSRSDRKKRRGGGVLLYSHGKVPVTDCCMYDDGICEGLFCQFQTEKICIAVVYRPPGAEAVSFSKVMKFVERCIWDLNDDSYQLCLTGDFNFSCINWESGYIDSGSNDRLSAQNFKMFLSRFLMNQYVNLPTRLDNILDLFSTNNPFLVTFVSTLFA